MSGVKETSCPPGPRRPRRILHTVVSLELGGSERQMVEVARRQSAAGDSVTVACLRQEGPLLETLHDTGIEVVEFATRGSLLRPRGIYQLLRLAIFLRRKRFDVVHAHDLWANLMTVPSARLAFTPVVISSQRDLGHLDWYTARRKPLIGLIHRLATRVVPNSLAVRNFLVNDLAVRPERIQVLHNAVAFEKYAGRRTERRRVLPEALGDDVIGAVVANMNGPIKGHNMLIAAAGVICLRHPHVRFVFVGDGPERPKLVAQARALGLEGKFIFTGRRSDVADVLACADFFVHPSTVEGLPNAVLEAMAAGLPVIATAVGGTPEIIEDGVSGLMTPPGDVEGLADVILRVLDDPSLASRLGHAGQERVRVAFSFEQLLAHLEKLYDFPPASN